MPAESLSIRHRAKLIVGIDYGTTYSGMSFALTSAADFKDIKPWTKYPGSSSHNAEHCEKAPSIVAYASENEEFLDQNAWGYELHLDSVSLPSEFDDPDLKKSASSALMRLPRGKTAKEVVTDYMRGMNKMFTDNIVHILGGRDKLRLLPMDVWVTVPATWSEQAKTLTREAAIEAGFASRPIDQMYLIPEPEAAAHLSLKSSLHHTEDLVEQGTGVMVCDCGGGTVDITTYEITCVAPKLKLREICVGVGGKCGGTFVDRNLYKLMAERFGTAFTSRGKEQTGPGSQFMTSFEGQKKDFKSDNSSKKIYRLYLPMPDLPRDTAGYKKRYSQIVLSYEDMKNLFDPVVEKIISLVNNQVAQVEKRNEPSIKTMVLVGGFGSSPYLREKLGEWCTSQEIRLTTPYSGGWSAIACGAVLRGLEGGIISQKKCRRHYGHSLSKTYDSILHNGFDAKVQRLWTDKFTGVLNLSGFMMWEIGKGDLVDETTEINTDFFNLFSDRSGPRHAHKLYACSLDDSPDTLENNRIELVGEVDYSDAMQDIDLSKLQQVKDSKGVTHYKIYLVLNIRLGDDSGLLQFRILWRGREMGEAKLGFSYC
ncbi:hsp70-like protein [Ilyonectria destructans]|nr:hsp70-like protein [Ilyonectria destructans]